MRGALAAYAAAFAAAAAVFLLFPGIDLWAAGLFYRPGAGFFLGDTAAVRIIYRGVPYLTDVIVAGVPALYLFGRLRGRPVWRIDGRAAAFLLLALALGPGLVVNTVLKDHWGRARPSQVTEFGGAERFTPAPLPADQCPRNCSFPAGHPAMGYYLVAFALLVPEPRRRRLAVGAAIGLGAAIGVARMAAGGHFLSDVVFSGFIVAGVTRLVYRAVIADDWLARHLAALSLPRRLALPALLLLASVLLSMAFLDRRTAWFFHDTDPGVRQVFEFITQFGLGKGYLIISAALFAAFRLAAALGRDGERAARLAAWAQRALYVFLAVAVSGLIADVMKPVFGRARPKLLFADGIYGFNWGAMRADYWSFPSGHATTMGALVVALAFLWPRGLPLYLIAALLVMASRIIITAHYPSDVLVGAVLGAGTAWALRGVARAGAAPGRGAGQPLPSAE
ncbi:MAG TPA: phosphatase PAP2 family protein, partial [Stellaceae bacterium]|nr:phosphatase PAP2 family protein [Stellaceae bacterium]